MAGQNTLTFTDATFESDVLSAEVPVLVDFWGRMVRPLPHDGPYSRPSRGRLRRKSEGRQSGRR